jgi:hypothetical protein
MTSYDGFAEDFAIVKCFSASVIELVTVDRRLSDLNIKTIFNPQLMQSLTCITMFHFTFKLIFGQREWYESF